MRTFLKNNQVLISGLAGAILVVLQQYTQSGETSYKALLLAVAIAVGGYLANNLRGKGVSVAGLLGVAGGAFATIAQTGELTWTNFFVFFIMGFLALIAPPPKSEGYERTDTIQTAKDEGKAKGKIGDGINGAGPL
jgi:hypothetical protein